MVGFKFLVLVAVLATVTLTYGKRAKKGGANMDMFKGVGGAMACESKDEFNECKVSQSLATVSSFFHYHIICHRTRATMIANVMMSQI